MFTWPYHHSHLDNDQVRRILQLPPSSNGLTVEPAVKELQEALTAYLRRATETFDLSKNVEVSSLSLCVPSFLGGWDCASGGDGRSGRQRQLKILRLGPEDCLHTTRNHYVGRASVNWCGLALCAQAQPNFGNICANRLKFGRRRAPRDLGLMISFKM